MDLLIPGYPLDGGRVFRAMLIAANLGRFIAYGFIRLGVWQMFGGNFGNGL